MKKIFILVFVSMILISLAHSQNANKTLSNLTSPIAINADLLPGNSNSVSLGSNSKTWKTIYVKGNLYLDGEKFISNAGSYSTFAGSKAGDSNTGS